MTKTNANDFEPATHDLCVRGPCLRRRTLLRGALGGAAIAAYEAVGVLTDIALPTLDDETTLHGDGDARTAAGS